ncbi:MAG: IS1634 family transposase, partial [Candidatus Thermoplasmatota archaeon]|nr:IS1634 family transposase [Candidatus Thermoplasmatota archaeon]
EFGAKLVSLGLKPSLVLWDTSNYSTNIENWGDKELPNPGYAKDKRFDKNIIGTGIVLSKDEIPLYHSVYPRNENDAHLFKRSINEIVSKIQKLCRNSSKITIVFDKGNNSEDNIREVLENCHIVGSISFDEVPDLLEIPLEEFKFIYRMRNGTALKAYRTSRELWNLGEFTVIVTYNPNTKKRQARTWEKRKENINKKLTELKEKFERKKGRGKRMTVKGLTTNITQAIPKQYRAVYWWDIDGKNRKFEWKLLEEKEEKMMEKFGKNVIFTDLKKWDTRRTVKAYHSKYKVEKTFRWLHGKLLIPIPPVYHDKDDRIRVHIFLCVMALSFIRLIKKQLRRVTVSDEQLLEELRDLQVALVKDVRTGDIQLKVKEMNPVQAAVFSQLGLDRYIKVI